MPSQEPKQQGAQRNNNEHSDSRQGQGGSTRAIWSMQPGSNHAWQSVREMGSIQLIRNQTSPGTRSHARCEASPSLILVSFNGGLLIDRLIPSGQGGIRWRRRYGPVRGGSSTIRAVAQDQGPCDAKRRFSASASSLSEGLEAKLAGDCSSQYCRLL